MTDEYGIPLFPRHRTVVIDKLRRAAQVLEEKRKRETDQAAREQLARDIDLLERQAFWADSLPL